MEPSVRACADLRLLRAALFAAVCVGLSAVGHALAGGETPAASALAAGWLAVTCAAVPFAGRRRSARSLAPALFGGQLALHVLFALASRVPSGGVHATRMATGRHLLCGGADEASVARAVRLLRASGVDPASLGGMPPHAGGGAQHAMGLFPSGGMLAAHAVAALLLGVLLWRGDVALFVLTARPAAVTVPRVMSRVPLVLVLLAAVAGAVDAARLAARAVRTPSGPPHRGVAAVRHQLVRRGPPGVLVPV
ncbi:hypothetical protein [Streptomyces sp. NPDC050560]|uniref:hypothetical protein n=1 Tax=Streptomyces sp. NPDC050560 TaxID=3365630 RepID=UPI00379E1E6C